MDKLVVTGLGRRLDGEYEFDLSGLLGVGTPDSLTNRELHRIKVMSGVRAGELEDALVAFDNDVLVALAAVVLTRHGKVVDEEKLWDAPAGSGLRLEIGERDEDDPPVVPAETPDSASGGGSPSLTLANPVSDQSSTGHPASLMSVTSGQAISAT